MLHRQSDKAKNGDRVIALSRVEDKCNWDNVNFPTSFDDITTFETTESVLAFSDTTKPKKSTRYVSVTSHLS